MEENKKKNPDQSGLAYVTHTCKDKKCRAGFVDTDDCNAQDYPPTTKYCPDCRAKGMVHKQDIRGKNGTENLVRYHKAQKAIRQARREAKSDQMTQDNSA